MFVSDSDVGNKFKFVCGVGWGCDWVGHELSGALLHTERALSNIIWILFDYIFFRIN